jgi:aminoglycoside phosphotransferase (APT) family kinase protein
MAAATRPAATLAIPVPLAMGTPGEGYPWHWSVYRWIEGENASSERLTDLCQAATDLAHFIVAYNALMPQVRRSRGNTTSPRSATGPARRSRPCRYHRATRHRHTRYRRGNRSLGSRPSSPVWPHSPVCIHGDLQSGNLLAREGRLHAVIDFGGLGVGDPQSTLSWLGIFSLVRAGRSCVPHSQ